ncbi:MAG: hypothetical protein RIA69_00530 [Cyclobacteriaceae bacterium]
MVKAIFNQGRIIPSYFRWILTIAIFVGIYRSLAYLAETPAIILSISLSFLIPPIWSSYKIIAFNNVTNQLSKAFWITGLIVTKSKYHLTELPINIRLVENEFISYLLIEDGVEIRLTSHENEKGLRDKMKPFLKKIEINIRFIE